MEMEAAKATAEATAKKRLAVFLDGTWNTVGDNTNVWRLKSLCSSVGADGVLQLVYYDAGLGTQFGEKVRGGMFGYGLNKNLQDAYEWLIDNFNEGDELFIFGFSRGAYTARSLAGFLALCGLLQPGAPLSIKQLFKRYRLEDEPRTIRELIADNNANKLGDTTLEDRWVLKYSRAIPIKMVAVWDTVGALGIPAFNFKNVSRSSFKWLHTGLRTPIDHGFHAVAIDEHREAFAQTLWTKNTRKDGTSAAPRPLSSVEQRWFAGAHANVGGGCENDLLAQLPLQWIMKKATLHGLAFRSQIEHDAGVHQSPISDSYSEFAKGWYKIVKFGTRYYRVIGAAPIETADYVQGTVNETIDASVFDRWRAHESYRPHNIIDWAKRYEINPATVQGSVRADSPNIAVD